MAGKNRSNELKLTRVYDAPLKMVWDAWTDPKQVAQWWGPRGFTLTTHSKDLRPGGTWHYTMHGPDGVDYPNKTQYLEVEKYARLVYDHGANDDRPPLFRVSVLFKEVKGKTQMEMTMILPSPEAAEQAAKFIKKAGGNSTWDRLAEYLSKATSGKDRFVINRSFNAPIEAVFGMWTDPRQLAKWLPPSGMDMRFLRSSIGQGTSTFYLMTGAPDVRMHARSEYLEIDPPYRIVYTQQFCDENEKVSRPPFAEVWPETILNTVTFSEEGPGQTRVTLTSEVHGTATPEEIAAFISARGGMTQGWSGSFDKLEELFETLRFEQPS